MTNNPPKGRDIMAVYTFYSGEVIQQKYKGQPPTQYIGPEYPADNGDAKVPPIGLMQFLCFDNGVIRQTKDIEKVVWSYC